jgi:hypothetical protein
MDEDGQAFGGGCFALVQQEQAGAVAHEQQTDVDHGGGALRATLGVFKPMWRIQDEVRRPGKHSVEHHVDEVTFHEPAVKCCCQGACLAW